MSRTNLNRVIRNNFKYLTSGAGLSQKMDTLSLLNTFWAETEKPVQEVL
jgi:hypothetical protein